MTMSMVKFVGLTAEAATAIETHRRHMNETESDIISRVLNDDDRKSSPKPSTLDVGQGIQLNIGETAYLFLSKSDAIRNRPAKAARITPDGFELDGQLFAPERGSYVQKPMRYVQEKLGHVNDGGNTISLSAYRQWHVLRDGKMVPLESLKDPAKARRRRSNLTRISAEQLDRLLADIEP